MANKKYTIVTSGGATPGVGFVGGSALQMLIFDLESTNGLCGVYTVLGVGVGFTKAKLALAVGPSATSDFESPVQSVDQFFGQVQSSDVTGAIGIGYNWQRMVWVSGPAKGTVCEGTGWLTMLGASIGSSNTLYTFKFVMTSTKQSRKKILTEYHEPDIRRVHQRQF